MKLSKLAVATGLALGASGAALAESTVTLYGILDGGVGVQKVKYNGASATKTGMFNGVQSGNRWGIRGSEDLGNGNRAVFVIESGFALSTGQQGQGGRLFGRQATLGLASDTWGQLDIGRQTNIASKYITALDPFSAGFEQASMGSAFGSMNSTRYDNMLMYQTPNWNGVQAGIGYSFSTGMNGVYDYGNRRVSHSASGFDSSNNMRAITAGVRYSAGPVYLSASYDLVRPNNSFNGASESSNLRSWIVGGSYDFEVAKVSVAYGQQRNGIMNGFGTVQEAGISSAWANGGMLFKNNVGADSYLVGVSAPAGQNGRVLASWTMMSPKGDWNINTARQSNYSVGYTYNLSKRTNLYAAVSYSDNYGMIDGATSTFGVVGVRHRF